MTRLKDALAEAAEQAPPLGDIADRALAQSRRRRLRIGIPMAAAAVAASAAVVAGVTTWPPTQDSSGDLTTEPAPDVRVPTGTIQFPDHAEPLPAEDVGPVALAYSMTCDGKANANQCQWRVMTAAGEHYTVPDAAYPDGSAGLADRGLLTVSPDGERLGYFRASGTFVLRDLASGRVEQTFSWRPNQLSNAWPELVWSANGRWLAVGHNNWEGKASLVDTRTPEATDLPMPAEGGVFGIRDNGDPLYESDLPERFLTSLDGASGSLGPDGRTLAALTFPEPGVQVNVVDIEEPRLVDEYPIDRDFEAWNQPTFAGWADRSSVLVYTFDVSGPSDPNRYRYPANVDAFDVRTGKLERVFQLPDSPRALSVAAGLIGAK